MERKISVEILRMKILSWKVFERLFKKKKKHFIFHVAEVSDCPRDWTPRFLRDLKNRQTTG